MESEHRETGRLGIGGTTGQWTGVIANRPCKGRRGSAHVEPRWQVGGQAIILSYYHTVILLAA